MDEDSQDNESKNEAGSAVRKPSGSPTFWAELKPRKVMRVAITYAVVAWVIMQVSSIVFPQFDIPVWAGRLVTLILVICFPISLTIA